MKSIEEYFVFEVPFRVLHFAEGDEVRSFASSASSGKEVLAKPSLLVDSDTCSLPFVVDFSVGFIVVLWSPPFPPPIVVCVPCPVRREGPLLAVVAAVSVAIVACEDRGFPEAFDVCIKLSVVAADVTWSTRSVLE